MKLAWVLARVLVIIVVGEVFNVSADDVFDTRVQYVNIAVTGQNFLLDLSRTQNIVFPSKYHPSIYVVNIGKIPVEVAWAYGTPTEWTGTLFNSYLLPGEKYRIGSVSEYYYTGLKVNKFESNRGIIYAQRYTGLTGKVSHNRFNTPNVSPWAVALTFLNTAILIASSQYGSVANAVVARDAMESIFFPPKVVDPWDQIQERLENRIRQSEKAVIRAILTNEIKPYDKKVDNALEESEDDDEDEIYRETYMQLARDFIGLEEKFVFTDTEIKAGDVNYFILPLYTRVINMKLMYYTWGATYGGALNLRKGDVKRIIRYRSETVIAARKHIVQLYQTQVDATYSNCDPTNLYNAMMEVRTFVAEHGLRYIQTWNRIAEPTKYTTDDNSILTYSEYYGRQTPDLDLQAVVKFGTLPLTPPLLEKPSGMYRVDLEELSVHLSNNILVGLELVFANKEKIMLGTSATPQKLVLAGRRITKMLVRGGNLLDFIQIFLSDGSQESWGNENSQDLLHEFSSPDSYIASIFVANDQIDQGHHLSNIAVSYLPFEIKNLTYPSGPRRPRDD